MRKQNEEILRLQSVIRRKYLLKDAKNVDVSLVLQYG